MHINKDNDADICHFAAMLEAAEMRGHTRGYAMGKSDVLKSFPEHLPAIDPESRKKLNSTINEAAEFIRQEAYDKGYKEATADAMKVARQEDPIHVAMVPLSDAFRAREKVGYDKGHVDGYQKGWEAGHQGGVRNAVLAMGYANGDGYGEELRTAIQARDTRARKDVLVEIDKAWSWWIGATVDGRIRPNDTSGNTARDRAAYYLAQAAQWAWNHNNAEVSGPFTRAMILQEGRKEGHAAAVDFAKQVIAGTLRDPSYGIKDAVDARVRSAEMTARDEGYTRGRDEAFHSAGLMAQAALKSGGFSRFDSEGKELAEALDGFLERERDYRSGFVGEAEKSKVRQATIETCWNHMVDLAESAADGRAFPKVIGLPTSERQRVEAALTKLQTRWTRAASLVGSYTHGGGLQPTTPGEMAFAALLRELRRDSYLDGFDFARKKSIRDAHDLKAPHLTDIPDPVSDVPF